MSYEEVITALPYLNKLDGISHTIRCGGLNDKPPKHCWMMVAVIDYEDSKVFESEPDDEC